MKTPSEMTDEELLAAYNSKAGQKGSVQDMTDEELVSAYNAESRLTPNLVDTSVYGSDAKTSDSPMEAIAKPITDVFTETARGALQSAAGLANKVDAVALLASNKFGLNTTDVFARAEEEFKKSADALDETDLPFKELYQFAGSIPVSLFEYLGVTTAPGIIGRAALAGALNEYGNKAEDMSLIKGAASGAAWAGAGTAALWGVGKGMEVAADALERHGPTAAKFVLKSVMPKGYTDEDLAKAYAGLEKYASSKYKKTFGTSDVIEKEGKFTAEQLKKQSDEYVYNKEGDINYEYATKRAEAVSKFDEQKEAFAKLEKELVGKNKEKIAIAQTRFATKLAENKQALADEATDLALGLEKKLTAIRKADNELIRKAVTSIARTNKSAGVAANEFIVPRISKVVKEISIANNNFIKTAYKEGKPIFSAVRKEHEGIANKLNEEISSIYREIGNKRVLPLDVMNNAKEIYRQAARDTQDNLTQKLYNELANVFNPVAYAGVATGGNQALLKLAEANRNFASKADAYRTLMDKLVIGGKSNVDNIISAFKKPSNRSNAIISEIEKSEKILPEKDRILGKLRSIAERTEKSDKMYFNALEKVKADTKRQENELASKIRAANREYRKKEKLLNIDERREVKDTIKNLRDIEAEKLDLMKRTLDEKIAEAKMSEGFMALRQPNEASLLRIGQNFAAFGALGAVTSGNVLGAIPTLAAATAMSPRAISATAKGIKGLSQKAPEQMRITAKKVLTARDIAKLIAAANTR